MHSADQRSKRAFAEAVLHLSKKRCRYEKYKTDGFAMFADAVCVVDYVSEDYLVLANYILSFQKDETTGLPTIRSKDGYGDVYGSGRITVIGGN